MMIDLIGYSIYYTSYWLIYVIHSFHFTAVRCIQTPGPRAFHTATFFEGRFYIFGGRAGPKISKADTWYGILNILLYIENVLFLKMSILM